MGNDSTKFDVTKFLRSIFWILIAMGVGIGTVAQDVNWAEFNITVPAVVGLAYAALRSGARWYAKILKERNENVPWWVALLILPVCVCLMLTGCVYTKTSERALDADGVKYHFDYSAISAAPPFGKIDDSVHTMSYTGAGEQGGSLTVGQDVTGLTGEGQIEALRAMGDLLGNTLASMITSGVISGGGHSGGTTGTSGLIERIERIEQAVGQIAGIIQQLQQWRDMQSVSP